jgi:hypothetical protein
MVRSGVIRHLSNMNLLPLIAHVVEPPFLDANLTMIATAHTDGIDTAARAVDHTGSGKGASIPSFVLVTRRLGTSQSWGELPIERHEEGRVISEPKLAESNPRRELDAPVHIPKERYRYGPVGTVQCL